jgi:hypothetical protein
MRILLAAGSPRPTAYESGVRLPSSPPIRMFDVWRGCFRMSVAGATALGLAARRDAQPCRACLQVRGPRRGRAGGRPAERDHDPPRRRSRVQRRIGGDRGSGRSRDEASSWLVLATEKADQRVPGDAPWCASPQDFFEIGCLRQRHLGPFGILEQTGTPQNTDHLFSRRLHGAPPRTEVRGRSAPRVRRYADEASHRHRGREPAHWHG